VAQIRFANYISTTLVTGVSPVQTILQVANVAGMPALAAGDYFFLTLIDQVSATSGANPPAQREIVKVTSISAADLTVVRGQDGTTAQNWPSLSVVELRFNAQAARDISTGGLAIPIAIAQGGTGQTTQQPAINALTNAAAASAGAALVRTPAGNAVFIPVSSEINVKIFGALGNNAADDTAAIVAAIAAANTLKTGVYFPTGTYLTSPIVVGGNVTYLRGDGPAASIIKPIRVAYPGLTTMVNFNNNSVSPGIYDIGLDVDDPLFSNCWGIYFGCDRFTARNCRIVGQLTIGFNAQQGANALINRCRFLGTGVAGINTCVGTTVNATAVVVEECFFEGVFSYAVNLASGAFNRIVNNAANGSFNFTYCLEKCTHSVIENNQSFNSQFESFQITDSQFCSILNNRAAWVAPFGQDFGISVAGNTIECKFCVVAGNTLDNSYKAGIALASFTTNTLVQGNNLHNCAVREQLAVGPTAMIGLYTDGAGQLCAYNRIQNNTLWTDTTPITYGISEIPPFAGSPVDNNFFDNNQIFNTIAPFPYQIQGAATNVIDPVWRNWVPTLTTNLGGGFTASVQTARYQVNGKSCTFNLKITVTAPGTPNAYVNATLPFTPVANGGVANGLELAVIGELVAGGINASGISQLRRLNAAGFTNVLNYQLAVAGTYEIA
jgi:hypothetical protein